MAEKIVIAELDIDVDELESSQANILKQQQSIKSEQKILQAELKKTGQFTDEQAKAYVKNDAALKNLNQSYNTNKKVLAESTTSIAGLNDALNKQIKTEQQAKDNNRELIKARGQLDKTSKDYAKNVEIINNRIDENNEFLADNGSQLEKQRLNIGNYQSALEGATGQLDRIAPGLGKFSSGLIEQTRAAAGSTKGLKAFRLALISTGIGAIVVALGTLIAAFASTQKGVDEINKVLRPLQVIFQRIIGLVQDLALDAFGKLQEAIKNPTQALKDLGQILLDNVINRFKAFAVLGESIVKLLQGDFKEGFKGLADGAVQLGTGITDATDKIGKAAKATGEFIRESVAEGTKLDNLIRRIEKSEIELIKNRAELNTEFERQKSIAEDVTQSEEARIKAAQAAQAAQNELLRQEQEFIDLKIERMELEQSFNDSSREDEKELAELIAQRTEFEAAATGKRVSVRNLENSIRQGIRNEEKKRAEERKKEAEAEAKAAEERVKEELAREKEKQAELARIAKEEAEKRAAEERLRKAIEFEEELQRIEQNGNDRLAIRMAELAEEERLAIEAANREIENEELKQRKLELINQQFADARVQIKAQEEANKFELVSQTAGNIATIFGEQTELGKAAAIVQTTIDTYKAAQSAYAAMAGIPVVGPVLGGIAAGAAVATGLRNVQRITGIEIPKFEKGGLKEVGGKSHSAGGTKFYGEDGSAFEAEKGEMIGVMNRNAASMFMKYNNKNRNGGYYNPFMDMAGSKSGTYVDNNGILRSLQAVNSTIAKKPVSSTSVDKHGFTQFISDGQNQKKYVNKNFLT